MGFKVHFNMMCLQAMSVHCTNPGRESCDECAFDHPDTTALLKVATDEFFEVVSIQDQF
jgi:hypothetical protein